MTTNPTCSLRPATATDVRAMITIFADAFQRDRHTQFKIAHGLDPIEPMRPAIASWISSTRHDVLVAADENDIPIGWACWGRHGYDSSRDDRRRPHQDSHQEETDREPTAPPLVIALQDLTNRHMHEWQAQVVPGQTRCRILTAIAVSPEAQSEGVGSLLVDSGTSRADNDGVFCWVHASEAGVRVFERAGFEQRQQLDIDLNAYVPAAEHSTDRWGTYVFRYFVREPAAALPVRSE